MFVFQFRTSNRRERPPVKGTSWQPCHVCYFYEASSPVLQLLPVVVVQPRSLPLLRVACVPFQYAMTKYQCCLFSVPPKYSTFKSKTPPPLVCRDKTNTTVSVALCDFIMTILQVFYVFVTVSAVAFVV